jgi:hypothetical protein
MLNIDVYFIKGKIMVDGKKIGCKVMSVIQEHKGQALGLLFIVLATLLTLNTGDGLGIFGMFLVGLCLLKHCSWKKCCSHCKCHCCSEESCHDVCEHESSGECVDEKETKKSVKK